MKDVTEEEPYSAIVGRTLTLQRPTILAKNLDAFVYKEAYFLTEDEELYKGVEVISTLPVGTIITIHHAFHATNGTSGLT